MNLNVNLQLFHIQNLQLCVAQSVFCFVLFCFVFVLPARAAFAKDEKEFFLLFLF